MENDSLLKKGGIFEDRIDAGKKLSRSIAKHLGKNPIVLALPRGGVTVGHEVARRLQLPLDVIVTRKIGDPYDPEFAIGAVSENGVKVLDEETIRFLGIPAARVRETVLRERAELKRRIGLYRHSKPLPSLSGLMAIIVDDGLATGMTALATIQAVKKMHPRKIMFAVPVSDYETIVNLRDHVDSIVCLSAPVQLQTISMYYRHFPQVTDEEVMNLLS